MYIDIYIYTHIGHGSCFAMPRNAEARFKLSVQAMFEASHSHNAIFKAIWQQWTDKCTILLQSAW